MCGIVGYIGEEDARGIILDGLQKLEYRGYDSAGIALVHNGSVSIYKDKGRVAHLRDITDFSYKTNIGIGHTRWATHGEPNQVNAHPHTSQSGRFTIVHNGVIENYRKLKTQYLTNYVFKSQTDTEVIADLLEYFSNKMTVEKALTKTFGVLEGSFALLIIDNTDLSTLYFAKNKTPMVVGTSDKGVTIGSDIIPLAGHADKYYSLPDRTYGKASAKGVEIFDLIGLPKEDVVFKDVDITADELGKGQYDHYMMKEIHEEPFVIRRLIQEYFDGDDIKLNANMLAAIRECDKINLVACGTSMHASYMAKYFFEKFCRIPSEVFCASELVYSTPLIRDNPCFIFLSQSGETADSIACMKKFKEQKFPLISITNVASSSMASLSDYHLDLFAGPEIAVASTKAYVAEVVVSAILAKGVKGVENHLRKNLDKCALAMESVLAKEEEVEHLAKKLVNAKDVFFIGRGIDYWSCLEASLKLKEISYIHSEAFPSGELKHGTIALIEKGTPVVAICTQEGTNSIVRSNMVETQARGSEGIIISTESLSDSLDDIVVPDVNHYLSPLVTIVVAQLLAYYVSVMKGNDVDKPKNLAKSVTVE